MTTKFKFGDKVNLVVHDLGNAIFLDYCDGKTCSKIIFKEDNKPTHVKSDRLRKGWRK